MTRFARAKGSKASNVKTPADSTPWEIMKEQLLKSKKENEEASKREEAENQRIENYNKFLKEQKTQKRQATWCDFPEAVQVKKAKVTPEVDVKPKKQKKKKNKAKPDILQQNAEVDDKKSLVDNCENVGNKKHDKNKIILKSPQASEVNDNVKQTETQKSKKKKKKNKKLENKLDETGLGENINNETSVEAFPGSNMDSRNVSQTDNPEGKKKKKNKKKVNGNPVTDNNGKVEKTSVIEQNPKSQENKKKKLKTIGGNPTRRKAINDHSFELIINGKNIQLVRFDGFPIMKKDAERLQELKNNMIKKGIPKTEVQRTMKLERRRAEKALARIKREVCYNCRKGGHNLSDCPDLKSNIPGKEAAEGICFKCGSTEHRQFECKVQRDKEFRFATCFICKESGHIARQCPDNPKGLYPNGGCCKLCGDVTHLRKDCPTVMDKKEESSIKLQTLGSDNIEGIDQQVVNAAGEKQKKPKTIKF